MATITGKGSGKRNSRKTDSRNKHTGAKSSEYSRAHIANRQKIVDAMGNSKLEQGKKREAEAVTTFKRKRRTTKKK